MTSEHLADQWAIRELAYRYAEAIDTNDGERLAALFTPDGAIEASNGTVVGSDALRALIETMRGRYLKTFHAVLNQIATVDGDRATASTYCVARHLIKAPAGNHACYEMTIRYADALLRTDGNWLFERRVLHLQWTQVYQVNPPT